MSELQVIEKLRTLASNASTKKVLLSEGSYLTVLVKFLGSQDTTIVQNAVEVLFLLSSQLEKESKEIMVNEPRLVETLKSLMLVGKSTPAIQQKATATFSNLQSAIRRPLQERTPGSYVSSKLGTATTYSLYIKGLNTEQSKAVVESSLIKIKGVISFLIDIFNQKATVRSLTSLDNLIDQIKQYANMQATSFDDKENTNENSEQPEYLDDKQDGNWGFSSIISWGSKAPKQRKSSNASNSSWFGLW